MSFFCWIEQKVELWDVKVAIMLTIFSNESGYVLRMCLDVNCNFFCCFFSPDKFSLVVLPCVLFIVESFIRLKWTIFFTDYYCCLLFSQISIIFYSSAFCFRWKFNAYEQSDNVVGCSAVEKWHAIVWYAWIICLFDMSWCMLPLFNLHDMYEYK